MEGLIPVEITLAAGINDASHNKQNAYDFLHDLLSSTFQGDDILPQIPIWHGDYYMKDFISSYQLSIGYKGVASMAGYDPYGGILSKEALKLSGRIPDSIFTDMGQWLSQIGTSYFASDLSDRLFGYFEPYYKGEKTYEECLKKAKYELEIYITE